MIIHKKCTRLKQSEFLFNKVSKDTVWECIDCQSKKFPFVTLTNHEIQNISFNSNFNCKCQTTVSDPNDPTYTLIYDSVNTSDRPEYKTVDVADANLEKITIQSNFKYYQNHDFHKFAQETDSKTVPVLYILIYVLCMQTKNI